MQQSHYLVKATAALSIEGAAAEAALAADAMGEDISVAPHNSNSPLPLLPLPRATAAILVYNINIYSPHILNFQREDSPVKAHQQQLLYRDMKPSAAEALAKRAPTTSLARAWAPAPLHHNAQARLTPLVVNAR